MAQMLSRKGGGGGGERGLALTGQGHQALKRGFAGDPRRCISAQPDREGPCGTGTGPSGRRNKDPRTTNRGPRTHIPNAVTPPG